MDAESGQLVFGGCVEADSWQLDSSFSCSEFVFSGQDKTLPDWAVDPDCVSQVNLFVCVFFKTFT